MNAPQETKRFWFFSSAESIVLLILLAALLVAVTLKMIQRSRPAGRGLTVVSDTTSVQHRIDLNAASQQELLLVPGIGPARAQKIIEHRREHGRFQTVSDLAAVDGFSERLVSQLGEYLRVRPDDGDGD